MRTTAYGVDYDVVAPVYDEHHSRRKEPDPHLVEFLRGRSGSGAAVSVLDVGCGTGNQLVADLAIPSLPAGTRFAGLDPFAGMLRVARAKSPAILWVQGDGTRLPFARLSFDYATNQFSHHHIADVRALFREIYRVLRPGGRFVLTNIAPRGMPDAQLYRWFPEALQADLVAHPHPDDLVAAARATGFISVEVGIVWHEWTTTPAALSAAFARRRDDSRLNALADDAYARGLAAIRAEEARHPADPVPDTVSLLTLTADAA